MKGKHGAILVELLLTFALLFAASTGSAAEGQRTFSFAVVPQQAPSKLLKSWAPILKHLEQRTGHRFVFRTAPDIPTFEERLVLGLYDFAYMNPYHFVVFSKEAYGYRAVAKAKDKQVKGIMVVRKDSPINSLAELQGETLAFPAPAAFAASVLPRAHMAAEGIDITPKYVSSHDSVYKTVAKGLFAAGGGVLRTFNATDPAVREQLRILWTTPGYTPHAIAAHGRVDAEVVAEVQRVLAEIHNDAGAEAILTGLKVKGFEAAENADWDDVRELDIDTRLGTKG